MSQERAAGPAYGHVRNGSEADFDAAPDSGPAPDLEEMPEPPKALCRD